MARTFIKKLYLGSIKLNNEVVVGDPCYGFDEKLIRLIGVKAGEYDCFARIMNCGDWGKRCGTLTIINKEYNKEDIPVDEWEFETWFPVDSGQAGIFHSKYFKDNNFKKKADKWYQRVCEMTISHENYTASIIDGAGFVSESGYGDGVYEVFSYYNMEDEIVALKIIFI